MRKWVAIGVLAVALTTVTWFSRHWWSSTTSVPGAAFERDADVTKLIEELKQPSNKVQCWGTIVPGGEILVFSAPMKDLIRMGERARATLHEQISDQQIQNEVVLVLGAIGDATTVPLLIEAYPEGEVKNEGSADSQRMKTICFTFALTYLTGEPIGRSRWGADRNPKNRKLWQEWWRQNHASFVVPAEKPNATWVPSYPTP